MAINKTLSSNKTAYNALGYLKKDFMLSVCENLKISTATFYNRIISPKPVVSIAEQKEFDEQLHRYQKALVKFTNLAKAV